MDVEDDVGALVDRLGYPVVVTGHSLGGALATLAAVDVTLNRPHVPVDLYTFGAPRIGNKAFAQWFDAQIQDSIRLVNNSDVVPQYVLRASASARANLRLGR